VHALRRALPDPAYRRAQDGYDFTRRCFYVASGVGRRRLLPDFLIIGAAKGGTTSLYAWLGAHPFVRPATQKQVHYYDENLRRGLAWYRSHFPLEGERAAFERENSRPFLTGEATPTYLSYGFRTAGRIARDVPDVKLIVTLRNPVDRAYSHYQMVRRWKGEPLPFEQAVAAEELRLAGELDRMRADSRVRSWPYRNWAYLGRSRYADEIEPWFEHFPRERFLFIKAEELSTNPAATVGVVHDFLGLPSDSLQELPRLNVAEPYEPMAPETRAKLGEYFKPHNQRLADLVGIDFAWERDE
jgi:hypothetical protein